MGANHTALEVADKLMSLSIRDETPKTPMQIQKLTYFCHGWKLGLGHGPLFQDAVESWQYGPVIRAVYHALKHHGSAEIKEPLHLGGDFSPLEEKIIERVWMLYGDQSGIELSNLTHAEGTPWHQTYVPGSFTQIIPNPLIRNYFEKIAAGVRQQETAK